MKAFFVLVCRLAKNFLCTLLHKYVCSIKSENSFQGGQKESMTANQLAYQANIERERANRAQEVIGSRQAESQERQAQASLSQARSAEIRAINDSDRVEIERFRSELEKAKTDNEIKEVAAKINRYQVQNGVDIANAVTGGIKNIGSLINPIGGLISRPTTSSVLGKIFSGGVK